MSIHQAVATGLGQSYIKDYLDSLAMVERLHRLMLDVIKDEFGRLGVPEINAVQPLLMFNIADNEVTAGELRTLGYYQGSNVFCNLKKLVDMGFTHHQRCEIDRRSVRVRLTEKGREVHMVVSDLFQRHADLPERHPTLGGEQITALNDALGQVVRFWSDQIRCIY